MHIKSAIDHLLKFSPDILTLNNPVNEVDIKNFEELYGLQLPQDYIYLLHRTNGFNLMGASVLPVLGAEVTGSLEESYIFEHFKVANPMHTDLIPFSPDGGGNHYCFDVSGGNRSVSKIVFWQHDITYSNEIKPELTHESLADWINEVVMEWTLEDFDYDGNEK
jgi:cell wall assembly regulator SMI1